MLGRLLNVFQGYIFLFDREFISGVKLRYRIIILLGLAIISSNELLAVSDYFFENDSALYRDNHKDDSAVLFVKKSTKYFELDSVEGNHKIVNVIIGEALNKCSTIEKFCKISY